MVPVESWALKFLFLLLFLSSFLFFLITACGKKKPTAQKPNQPPTLVLAPNQTNRSVDENQALGFSLMATDPEGVVPTLSALGLPKNAFFMDSGNGHGSFAWTPTFSQQGNYLFHFIASDGALADTVRVAVSVGNVNRPPYLLPIDSQFFVEGSARAFGIRGIDPDGDSIFLSADSIPSGAFFVDSANGRGGFFWSPGFNQSGQYFPIFSVTDRQYTDSKRPKLVVLDFDRAPEFLPVAGQRASEGQTISFLLSATDPDGDTISFSVIGLPLRAVFLDSGKISPSLNGRGSFSWPTQLLDAGMYTVSFIAKGRALEDTLAVNLQVDTVPITYTLHIKPLFDRYCAACHYTSTGSGCRFSGVCFPDYLSAVRFKDLIQDQVTAGNMPPGSPLPQPKQDTINAWVLRGAPQ